MKILDNEIIKEEHLYNGHVYCINFEKNKVALYKDNQFHFIQRNKFRSIDYDKSQVFGYCSEFKDDNNDLNILKDEKYSKIYEDVKNKLMEKRVKYTAAFIEKEDTKLLIEKFKDKVPKEWDFICHHMTIVLGRVTDENILNMSENITLTDFGINEELGVSAFKVKSNIPSKNDIKHITFAIRENANAFDSNKITNWNQLDKEIIISSNVGVQLNNREIIIRSKKSNKLKLN